MREHVGLAVAAMGGLIAFAVYGGALTGWTRFIPLWTHADWQRFGTPLLALAAALLAGIGVQVLYDGSVERRRFALAVAVSGAAFALIMVIDHRRTLGGESKLIGGLPLALVVTAIVVLVCLQVRSRTAAWVVVAVVVGELLLLAPGGFYSPREDPYPKSEWLDFLARETIRDASRVFSVEGILFPDTAGAYGLNDPRMLDALYIQRYWRYIRSFVSYGIEDRFTATSFAESAPAIVENPMFDLLGVRYVIFGADSQVDFPLGGDAQYSVAYKDDTVQILENTHALPRAFVVHDAQFVASEAAALRALRSAGPERFPNNSVQVSSFDPRTSAVVEDADAPAPRLGACDGTGDRARIVERSTTSMTIDVTAGCAGLLVVSDSYFPGWTATVRGKDAKILPTDLALRGVEVPGGRSQVVLRYEPRSFRFGLALSLLGVLVIVLIGIAGVRDIRRHSRTASGAPRVSSPT